MSESVRNFAMRESGVTHFCAAPTVLTMTIWDPEAGKGKPPRAVRIGTGGAPPTPALLQRLAELGMDITHLYGLTETYGPCVVCEWRSEWTSLPLPEQARLKSRQGVGNVISCEVRVVDDQGRDVPADAQTMDEAFREIQELKRELRRIKKVLPVATQKKLTQARESDK